METKTQSDPATSAGATKAEVRTESGYREKIGCRLVGLNAAWRRASREDTGRACQISTVMRPDARGGRPGARIAHRSMNAPEGRQLVSAVPGLWRTRSIPLSDGPPGNGPNLYAKKDGASEVHCQESGVAPPRLSGMRWPGSPISAVFAQKPARAVPCETPLAHRTPNARIVRHVRNQVDEPVAGSKLCC